MDNATYSYPSDCTPLTSCKAARKPAGSTVVNMGHSGKAPNDYLVWSLCNTLQGQGPEDPGDLRAAQECSDKAKWYNILASGWNLLIPLLVVVLLVLLLVHLGSTEGTFDFFGEDGYQSFMKLFSR
ncbi:hypothetical protein AGOR_G00001570 [Albula goreensis]|uniref:Uncharacterized protein n=1 Tax=Albula goreensis TaxID=1534307 RepID=A0A8T3EAJ8_9TELE|nr:hypothetical protein AGOR_G00001570 [Albula goreensis]